MLHPAAILETTAVTSARSAGSATSSWAVTISLITGIAAVGMSFTSLAHDFCRSCNYYSKASKARRVAKCS